MVDLLAITRDKIERADHGDHGAGLKVILLQIEAAVSHLGCGQATANKTTFGEIM